MRIIFALILITLVGCASTGNTQQDLVYKANVAFNVALASAIQYARLPRCGTTVPKVKVCSEQSKIDEIVFAQEAASNALNTAELLVRDPNAPKGSINTAIFAMNTSVIALNAIIATLPR